MSRNPIVVAFPPFFGFTRRVVIVCGVVYLAALVVGIVLPGIAAWFIDRSCLHPGDVYRQPWQFLTYPFIAFGLVSLLLALMSFWFFGSELEQAQGSRWFREFFFASTIGGALLAVLLSFTVFRTIPDLSPQGRMSGLWPVIMAMTLAFARLFPERELRLYFVITVKAKFLAAIYLIVYLGSTMTTGHRFDAMTTLCVTVCGFLYLRFAPRNGLHVAGSEAFFGLRNRYERSRRRKAAKKFTVYMKEQGKDVNLDAGGKYVSLDEEKRDSRDKNWMN